MKRTFAFTVLLMAVGLFMATTVTAQPTVDNRIFKKWLVTDEDGTQTLYDLTDKKHWKSAQTYTAEFCELVHGAYTPGVFYLGKSEEMRVTRGGHSYGTIEYKGYNGEWHEVCTYEDLTDHTVSFMFEGEFVWHAEECKEAIEVVNTYTEEINISDMIDVYNFYDISPNLMKDLFFAKQMKQLSRLGDGNGNRYEAWGRDIEANGMELKKAGENALAISYERMQKEYSKVSIFFADPNLIPTYEQQLARNGYFKKRVRQVEGREEITYANDEWTEGSDEPIYTLTQDGMGLYQLSYRIIMQ